MSTIEITPETTVEELAAVLTLHASISGTDPFLYAVERNLSLHRRIQEALETCASSGVNLGAFGDPDFTGMAIPVEDLVDVLNGTDEPVVTPVFFQAHLDMLAERNALRDEFWMKLKDVTRVTVVDDKRGRVLEQYGYPGVELHLQDNGRTLKVFPKRAAAEPETVFDPFSELEKLRVRLQEEIQSGRLIASATFNKMMADLDALRDAKETDTL